MNEKPSPKVTAQQIQAYRERACITQAELATTLGVRQASVSDWENGRASPSPLAVGRLLKLFRETAQDAQALHADYATQEAYDRMAALPEWRRAEMICDHYVRMFARAAHLLKFIEISRETGLSDDEMDSIKYMTDQLRKHHAMDLGIKLEWPPHETHHPLEENPPPLTREPPQEGGEA